MKIMERLHLSLHLVSLLNLQAEAVQAVIAVPSQDKHLLISSLESHIVNFNIILNNRRQPVQTNKPSRR